MATTGSVSVTITGGSAGAGALSGAVLQDGTYTVTVTTDPAAGVSIDAATPYGDASAVGFQKGDAIE